MTGYEVKQIGLSTMRGAVAITAMVRGGDGGIYVGMTGRSHVLARIDPRDDAVTDLGEIFPDRPDRMLDKVHNSLVEGPGGDLYIGQGLNIDWHAGPMSCDLAAYGGGHLYRFDIRCGRVEDLGVQVPLNAIHGLTIDVGRGILYGYTIPDNHFFVHHLDGHRVVDKGKISSYASHNLVCGKAGTVFGGWYGDVSWTGDPGEEERKHRFQGTYLFRYHPDEDRLVRTRELLVYGDEFDIFSNKGLDSLLCTSDGALYGGTAIGGSIFKVDEASGTATVIGKPVLSPRVSGMKEGPDGQIYITAGFPVMHLVRYDPRTNRFTDHGAVNPSRDLCYFHGLAVCDDGTVYVGETDAALPIVYKLTPRSEGRKS